jgi:tRNA U34 5-carboxymethylaminomethyl modifying GTPase MnmE/TrmE
MAPKQLMAFIEGSSHGDPLSGDDVLRDAFDMGMRLAPRGCFAKAAVRA